MSKKLVKNSLIYTAAQVFTMCAGLVSFPILTKMLSAEDYGLIGLYAISSSLIVSIGKLGIQHGILRLRGDYEESVFLSNLLALFFIGPVSISLLLVLCILGLNLSEFIALNDLWTAIVIVLIALSEMLRALWINYFVSKENSKLVANIQVISKLVTTVISLSVVILILSSAQAFILSILASELLITIIIIYLTIRLDVLKGVSLIKVNSDIYKPILMFGIPLLGLEIVAMFHAFSDRYIIKYFLGNDYLGYYSAHYNMSNIISELLIGGVMVAVLPVYMNLWNKYGKEKTQDFLNNIVNIFILILPILVSSLYVISEDLFTIFATKEYAKYSYLLPVISAGVLINAMSPVYAAGLKLQKSGMVMLYVVFISTLINVMLNVIFIPVCGLIAAALSTLVSFIFVCLSLMYAGRKTIEITLSAPIFVRGVIYSLLFVYISHFIIIGSVFVNLIIKITSGVFFYIIIFIIFERKYLVFFKDLLKK